MQEEPSSYISRQHFDKMLDESEVYQRNMERVWRLENPIRSLLEPIMMPNQDWILKDGKVTVSAAWMRELLGNQRSSVPATKDSRSDVDDWLCQCGGVMPYRRILCSQCGRHKTESITVTTQVSSELGQASTPNGPAVQGSGCAHEVWPAATWREGEKKRLTCRRCGARLSYVLTPVPAVTPTESRDSSTSAKPDMPSSVPAVEPVRYPSCSCPSDWKLRDTNGKWLHHPECEWGSMSGTLDEKFEMSAEDYNRPIDAPTMTDLMVPPESIGDLPDTTPAKSGSSEPNESAEVDTNGLSGWKMRYLSCPEHTGYFVSVTNGNFGAAQDLLHLAERQLL